jgi:hypothetical protein
LGFINFHFDAEIFAHNLLEVIARSSQDFEPAVFPIAYAGKPGRTTATGKTLSAAPFEVHFSVPIEHLTAPNIFDRSVVSVREELGRAK